MKNDWMKKGVDEFKPGDVVILKSGGPKMTVRHIEEHGYTKGHVQCTWFDGSSFRVDSFQPTSIMICDHRHE